MIIHYTVCICVGFDQALTRSAVPRLHQLDLMECDGKTVSVIRRAAGIWEQFATRLHFEHSDINRIRSDNPCQCRVACWKVCSEWLEGAGRKPISWETIIKALIECELSEIAGDLKHIIPDTHTI